MSDPFKLRYEFSFKMTDPPLILSAKSVPFDISKKFDEFNTIASYVSDSKIVLLFNLIELKVIEPLLNCILTDLSNET